MAGNNSFERFCRLCAEEQEVTVMLFSPEAEDKLLIRKIRNYFHIEINENTKLSKNICITCCSLLQTLSDFIERVRRAQNTLNALGKIENFNDISLTCNSLKEETVEFTEISMDPLDILNNMHKESSIEPVSSSWTDDIVTLKRLPMQVDADDSNEKISQNNVSCDVVTIKKRKKKKISGTALDIINKKKDKDKNSCDVEKSCDQKGIKKRFSCDVCRKSFLAEQSLKNHLWTHRVDLSCYTCQRSFKSQGELDKHVKAHKPQGIKYHCSICSRRFKTEYAHRAHMRMHDTAKNSFTCKVCGRIYENWAGLKIHSITHSTEKPFHCTLCDKKFKRNQELKFHMNYHTGAKPYGCKFCDKAFASTGNLYSHTNRVHRETRALKYYDETEESNVLAKRKRFKCYMCKKGFDRQENYTYHMFLHTGEKPYKCTHCIQKFITKRSLSTHYERIHPEIKKPCITTPAFCPIKGKWVPKPSKSSSSQRT